ncbi:MAG TPA: YceH family protein [Solirubrobacteraceae bacterium]|nr:YceH family protein [Solirubrobacteraceae bacterium]
MNLSAAETRVLGCLLEKQRTTPDVYPLSLNSLRLACNQSTNRDPVVDYDEALIRDALHRLERKGLTRLASGSRAAKHRHLLAEALPMSSAEQAIVCVLMLRGPQTPGELKQRSERMHAFDDLAGVHATLDQLIERELVARLERRPGHKEQRYAQLLQGADRDEPADERAPQRMAANTDGSFLASSSPSELHALRERIERLEREVAELRSGAGADASQHSHEEAPRS